MKKFLTILMACLFACVSVIPAFANEQPSDENMVLFGLYELNDQASLPTLPSGATYTIEFPVEELRPLDHEGYPVLSFSLSEKDGKIIAVYVRQTGENTTHTKTMHTGTSQSNLSGIKFTFHVPYDFSSSDEALGVWQYLGHNLTLDRRLDFCAGVYHTPHDVDLDFVCDWCYLSIPVSAHPSTCDGSACAWADSNVDGICDTCGFALYNFRYNLLDYAYSQKDVGLSNFTDNIYWLIVEGTDFENKESYIIYLSNLPYHFINGQLKTAGSTKMTLVTFNADGVPVGTGWTTISANTSLGYGSPVDSSVKIDGFFPPVGENPDPGEGSDPNPPDEGGEGDDDNATLLDRLLGIYNFIKSISTNILGLPQVAFDLFAEILNKISDTLTGLPKQILDGIRDIFIPDATELQNKFFNFIENLKFKFNFDTDFFTGLFNTETPVDDVSTQYYIHGVGNFNLKLLDTKYFVQGVEFFRPFIRGVIVLFMGFYNVRMMLSFIRQDAGVASGKVAHKKEE